MKAINKVFLLLLAAGLIFTACSNPASDDGGGVDNIGWEDEAGGTLTVLNNTSKDMVIFQGQTPSQTNIIGGVKALSTRTFDIEDDVSDFSVGGYIILRGIAKDVYEANKSNLSNAKAEYSAMATYGQGKKFRTEINPAYSGDYYFKITNAGRIGMELRKNSPDGEKIGYLPALATNYALYSNSTDSMTIFPVYVYYSNISKTVTTIRATSFAESASVGPRPVSDSSMATVRLPNDESLTWSQIANNIAYPVAFITVSNNVANQDSRFGVSSTAHKAQNGYDSINSGETLTFEIKATDLGQQLNLACTIYGGTVTVPVKQGGNTPTIKNGYDYTVTLTYTGGGTGVTDPNSYEATLTEGVKRDIQNEILSL
jgi:hypothetical protein